MKYENEKKIFYDTTLILTWPLMASVWPFWPLDIVLDIKSSVGNSNLKNFSKVKKKRFPEYPIANHITTRPRGIERN